MQMKLRSSEPQGGGSIHQPVSMPASGATGRKLEAWLAEMRQVQQVMLLLRLEEEQKSNLMGLTVGG